MCRKLVQFYIPVIGLKPKINDVAAHPLLTNTLGAELCHHISSFILLCIVVTLLITVVSPKDPALFSWTLQMFQHWPTHIFFPVIDTQFLNKLIESSILKRHLLALHPVFRPKMNCGLKKIDCHLLQFSRASTVYQCTWTGALCIGHKNYDAQCWVKAGDCDSVENGIFLSKDT